MPKPNVQQQPTEATGRAVRFGLSSLIALALLGLLWPSRLTWATNAIAALPVVVGLSLMALAVLAQLRPVAAGLSAVAARIGAMAGRILTGKTARIVAGSLVLFTIFFLLRSRSLLYGDAASIISEIRTGVFPILQGQYLLQVGTIGLMHVGSRIVVDLTGLSVMASFSAIVALFGVVASWAIVAISRVVAKETSQRVAISLAAFSSGAVLLFFGHLENYTPALAMALWTLYWSLRARQDSHAGTIAVGLGLVACFLHLITFPFLLTALLALVLSRVAGHVVIRVTRAAVWTAVIGSMVVVVALQVTGLNKPFVPPWPVEDNLYWLFSPGHIVDVVNLLVLHGSVGLVFWLAAGRPPSNVNQLHRSVLQAATVFTLLAAVWIDPELGAVRDFDLLSFFGMPLALYGGWRVTQRMPTDRLRMLAPSAAAVGLLMIAPWVVEQMSAEQSFARLNRLLSDDPHYQVTYQDGARAEAWATTITIQYQHFEAAIPYLKRRLTVRPRNPRALQNLAEAYHHMERYDSSVQYYHRAHVREPGTALSYERHAFGMMQLDQIDSVLALGRRAVAAGSENVELIEYLAGTHALRGEAERALLYLKRLQQLTETDGGRAMQIALMYSSLRQADSAYAYLVKAKQTAAPSELQRILAMQVAMSLIMGDTGRARGHLDELKRRFPASPLINDLQAKIEQR